MEKTLVGDRYKVAHLTTRHRRCLLGHTLGLPPGPMLQKHHTASDHPSRGCGVHQLSSSTPHAHWVGARTRLGHAWTLSHLVNSTQLCDSGDTLTPDCTQ